MLVLQQLGLDRETDRALQQLHEDTAGFSEEQCMVLQFFGSYKFVGTMLSIINGW